MTGDKRFELHLKKLREAKGLSQEQLAEAIGVEPQSISRIELGIYFTSFKNLIKLAETFRIPLKELFDFAEAQYTKEVLLSTINESLKNLEVDDLEAIYKLIIHFEYKNNKK